MSGRCKACDAILNEQELKTKWPGSDEYLDICFYCVDSSNELYDDCLVLNYTNQIELYPETSE